MRSHSSVVKGPVLVYVSCSVLSMLYYDMIGFWYLSGLVPGTYSAISHSLAINQIIFKFIRIRFIGTSCVLNLLDTPGRRTRIPYLSTLSVYGRTRVRRHMHGVPRRAIGSPIVSDPTAVDLLIL
eukprot:SAG31_NODE_203_length_20490_cov_7.713256_15_plen_125_part_00